MVHKTVREKDEGRFYNDRWGHNMVTISEQGAHYPLRSWNIGMANISHADTKPHQ